MFKQAIDNLKKRGLYRRLRKIESEQGPRVIVEGKEVILLSSNNYLGLANHPRLKEASLLATEKYGVGSGASRLISGNNPLYEELEERLARLKGTEAALVFSTGYMANLGVITTLTGKGDVIFTDELNHASIIDACRLSRAEIKTYRHKDIAHLEQLLNEDNKKGTRLIVTDGVFSMDGDIAPLPKIVQLAKRHSAILMVDDAHGTGVLGKNGGGTVEHFGLEGVVDIHMGTLGKALGSFGAYIAGSRDLIEYLINRSRPFIYTTALPPAILATAITAIDIIENEPSLREKLWANRNRFYNGIKNLGYNTLESETPIIPIFIGDTERTVDIAEGLFEKGIFCPAIRPPTVPRGTSRLRATVMATHTVEDIDYCIEVFRKTGTITI